MEPVTRKLTTTSKLFNMSVSEYQALLTQYILRYQQQAGFIDLS